MYTSFTSNPNEDAVHAVIGPSGSDTIQFTSELSKYYGVIQVTLRVGILLSLNVH